MDEIPGLLPEVAASEPARLAGIVLAGGESRRLGRDKANLPAPLVVGAAAGAATTMVEHTVGVVGQRCRPLFVVAAPGQRLPALQAQVVRDEAHGVGPLSAVGQGLRAAGRAGAERAFISAVDLPFLDADLIDELATMAAQVDADVVLPWDGRDHFLAAVYRTALAERIDAMLAAGERAMQALVDSVDAQRIVVTDHRLSNVNSADDPRSLTAAGR